MPGLCCTRGGKWALPTAHLVLWLGSKRRRRACCLRVPHGLPSLLHKESGGYSTIMSRPRGARLGALAEIGIGCYIRIRSDGEGEGEGEGENSYNYRAYS